ncbi:branched-chain amino acid transport system substrate-binding protein [Methylopila jiangsuensis]|uniref:transporter substrate-binding domain-containing protein n=1 Tax=Methylopila jiangsuensis TaxID=586230 RepID=UPI0022F305F4|nr:transporter substrate-binding domain-containing protein [Methylopila jiangsuensis]MDR6286379.1 branched-chain amino acid transport system substrate-binding protein [Methylopila jiangsuensis]
MTLRAATRRPLVVGALYSETGATAFVERTQLNATRLAIEEINASGGVDGREVVLVSHDAQSDPARFASLAEALLDEERADLLIGCYMTNTRQAVVPVAERRGALLAYAACYEGFEYSPNVIYGGAVPNQHILMLARHLMNEPGKRFYLVGTRYTFPIESHRVLLTLIAERKGHALAERYVPLDVTRRELDQIVQDIRRKKPDVVFCTVVGRAASAFYELCAEAGLTADTTFASLTITEAEVAAMPPRLAEGHLTAATYFQSVDTPENRRFVRAYQARFGVRERLNAMAETAYAVTHLTLAAVARAGSAAPEAVRRELADMTFRAPQGEIRLDPENSHLYLWPRIGRVQADGQFQIIAEAAAPVKPDPYLINHTLEDWDGATPPEVLPLASGL